MAIAAAASLASCTAQAPKANLKTDIDSLSYSIGMAQTQGLKGYLTGRLDVDTAYMAEFIKGLNEGANKTSKKDIAYMAGLQIGQQISNQMMKGINQELDVYKRQTLTNSTFYLNLSMMHIHNSFCQRQSDACPQSKRRGRRGIVRLIEPVEYLRNMFNRNPNTRITH